MDEPEKPDRRTHLNDRRQENIERLAIVETRLEMYEETAEKHEETMRLIVQELSGIRKEINHSKGFIGGIIFVFTSVGFIIGLIFNITEKI